MSLKDQPLGFLTLDRFLEYFPPLRISKDQFVKKFTVSYKHPVTLAQIYARPPGVNNPVIKKPNDVRWVKRNEVIDFFYDVVVKHRHDYLTHFYNSFFDFKDPSTLDWESGPDISSKSTGSHKKNALNLTAEEEQSGISTQKNDASRRLIRNLFYKDILDYTKITNSVKSKVSFWRTFDNLYNKLILEDRLFAPSSIDLFLKDKRGRDRTVSGDKEPNYVTLFYLIQNYQPKASIFNPYTIYWVLENILVGTKKLMTPVLSWGSYLMAFMHMSEATYYLGIDVIPRVCAKTEFLGNWYQKHFPETRNKTVEIYCQPSESLLHDAKFMKQYRQFFDTVLLCPPYFDMEIYDGGDQSIILYPQYSDWLRGYWEGTVKLSHHCVKKGGGWFAYVVNDYYDLNKNYYPLIKDLCNISEKYFKLRGVLTLYNRTSPLRANHKDRSEKLFIFSS